MQMKKIDQFTKTQLQTLKKRVKALREQVKDVKEGEGNSKLTQVSPPEPALLATPHASQPHGKYEVAL